MADDIAANGRRTLGVIDGALTQISLALILLIPTMLVALVRPGLLKPQIDQIQDEGHKGWLLAPGPFVVIGLFAGLVLISIAAPDSSGAMITMGEGVREAAGEGQLWRTASIMLPMMLVALYIAAVFFASGQIWRLKRRGLTPAVRAAQYGLLGFLVVLTLAEPASLLVGPGGDNHVFAPAVIALVGVWTGFFQVQIMSGADDVAWRRAGAALTAAAAVSAIAFIAYS